MEMQKEPYHLNTRITAHGFRDRKLICLWPLFHKNLSKDLKSNTWDYGVILPIGKKHS